MFPRLLYLDKIPLYQSFFLFGARGTGKSTWVRHFLENSSHPSLVYNFLKNKEYLRLQSSPHLLAEEIEAKLKETSGQILQVHLDEVQKVPHLLDEVHDLIEKHPKKLRFILSGSSARKLKRGSANLLAGRAWERHLYPLSSLEIPQSFQLKQALRMGTLPQLASLSPEEGQEYLHAYVSTYLKEEIQQEALTRRLDHFHRFLEAAAMNNGELLNFSQVAQEAMVPRKTVSAYYQILVDTLLGFFLQPWGHRQSRKQLVAHGKFYFFDPGIVSALTQRLSAPLLPQTPEWGRAFEHFCLLEFIRLHDYKRTEHRLGFFRTKSGAEVDLIQERYDKLRAIEIKATERVRASQVRGLKSFLEEFPKAEAIVLCLSPRPFQLGKIRCVPWQNFFKEEWERD